MGMGTEVLRYVDRAYARATATSYKLYGYGVRVMCTTWLSQYGIPERACSDNLPEHPVRDRNN